MNANLDWNIKIHTLLKQSEAWAERFCSIYDDFDSWMDDNEAIPTQKAPKSVDELTSKLLAVHSKHYLEYVWSLALTKDNDIDFKKFQQVSNRAEKYYNLTTRTGSLAMIDFFGQLMSKKGVAHRNAEWMTFPRMAADMSFDQCLSYFVPSAAENVDVTLIAKKRTSQLDEARSARSKKYDLAREEMHSMIKSEMIELEVKHWRSSKGLARFLFEKSTPIKNKYNEDQLYKGILELNKLGIL